MIKRCSIKMNCMKSKFIYIKKNFSALNFTLVSVVLIHRVQKET